MIHGYHQGRSSTDTLRRGAKFWYVGNGRLKAVPADRCGGRLYLGVELEVDSFPSYSAAERASDYVDSKLGQYAVCMHDGSLDDGFEIVFDPMTLAAFSEIRPIITEVMAELNRRGGHSHDSTHCGLHVHVSRAAFGTTDDAKDLAYGKILEMTARWMSQISTFARRDVRCTRWCRPNAFVACLTDGSRALRRKAKETQRLQGFDIHDDRRYRVWNFQNRNTVECRAFKGTLNPKTFYATLAFVDGFVRFATQATTPQVHEWTFDGLVNWIGNDDTSTYFVDRWEHHRIAA